MYGKDMFNLGAQKLCFHRAEDWDYFEISKWQAKNVRETTCSSNEVACGQGADKKFDYCVPKKTFEKNGSVCPVTSIDSEAPAAKQKYDESHIKWNDQ